MATASSRIGPVSGVAVLPTSATTVENFHTAPALPAAVLPWGRRFASTPGSRWARGPNDGATMRRRELDSHSPESLSFDSLQHGAVRRRARTRRVALVFLASVLGLAAVVAAAGWLAQRVDPL
jgi:hypothetical protein